MRYHFASAMRLAHLRVLLLIGIAVMLLAMSPCIHAQEIDSGYGPLPVFEFHSGFWVNLHHFLYQEARAKSAAKDALAASPAASAPILKQSPGSTVTLNPTEQKIWDNAVEYYRENHSMKDLQINIDLILLKDQLGDFEDCDELTGKKKSTCDAGLPGKEGAVLESVAPIYRAHWWADHNRANRRWVARVAPLVREQGVGLSQRLAEIYQSKWPKDKIRVDVCAYANAAGAYTTLDPLRVTISSLDPRNQGSEALEVLFHESSHGLALPVQNAIARECRQRDKPIPRNLWHALIYYTTTEVLRPILQGANSEAFTPALKSQGNTGQKPGRPIPDELRENLSQRGWEDYLHLLTTFWQPYLDGRVTFEDAIAHMVSAL
ncbi:MAG: hypothetical protein WAK20_11605 [Candidatus Acidiferrum sp.]